MTISVALLQSESVNRKVPERISNAKFLNPPVVPLSPLRGVGLFVGETKKQPFRSIRMSVPTGAAKSLTITINFA